MRELIDGQTHKDGTDFVPSTCDMGRNNTILENTMEIYNTCFINFGLTFDLVLEVS